MSHEQRGGVLCKVWAQCMVRYTTYESRNVLMIMYETHRVRFAAAAITCATYSEQRGRDGSGVRRTAHATARAPPSGASLSRVSSRAPGSACEAVDKGTEDGAVAHPAGAHWPPWAAPLHTSTGCGACAGRRSASASSGTAQYMSSSLWVSMTQSEVGLAVHVRTQPAAFCSSDRKPHAEVSIVPETSFPAQALHEPARQAYGRSA
mmetsp:Transcript_23667/g.75750  ORF Transcript_23667/g.75750 Transcript_23667/m.75750 type:complete len:206 (+) Transcript_23667:711-1328(+)